MNHRFFTYHIRFALLLAAALLGSLAGVDAQQLNDKLLNRPYADMRPLHLGFSIGVHTQDFRFIHNGAVINGEEWRLEQPDFSPGFCVNGLIDLRLNSLLNVRFTPGMYFGNRDVKMREYKTGARLRQDVKSAYVVMPVDLKFSGARYGNMRPYVTAGVMPTFNVTRQNGDYLRTKPFDLYLTTGFGLDTYLPYFKFIPDIKFCFGVTDVLDKNRPDLEDEPDKLKITQSLAKALSQMVVVTFYFE